MYVLTSQNLKEIILFSLLQINTCIEVLTSNPKKNGVLLVKISLVFKLHINDLQILSLLILQHSIAFLTPVEIQSKHLILCTLSLSTYFRSSCYLIIAGKQRFVLYCYNINTLYRLIFIISHVYIMRLYVTNILHALNF